MAASPRALAATCAFRRAATLVTVPASCGARPRRPGLGAKRKRVRSRRAPLGGKEPEPLCRWDTPATARPPPKPGDIKPSAWRFPGPPRRRATPLTRTGSVYLYIVSASASAVKGQAGFLGINDQTQGALFSLSPPSFPPQEQEKEKSVGNALFPPATPPRPPFPLLSPT